MCVWFRKRDLLWGRPPWGCSEPAFPEGAAVWVPTVSLIGLSIVKEGVPTPDCPPAAGGVSFVALGTDAISVCVKGFLC